ncbi:MAG: UDP-2,3-diacylglucosamine diphosphatase [Ignavibacteriales bacterium]|nr:UDP-2,3-diacylglucosamine diphosphatase [Ignavibacteriales bacterium]
MKSKYYFISDIHFGFDSPSKEVEKEKLFVEFIDKIIPDCKTLFILGDLFDYWFEYRTVLQKGYFGVFTALKKLTSNGTGVYYFIGNHDFMHRDFFEKEIGVKLLKDEISINLENKKFFLAHGDDFVKNDLGYKILKKILRSKVNQFLYSLLHPDIGIWLARLSSKKSRGYTDKKDYGKVDGLFEFAKKKIKEGYDYVIFGHVHRLKDEKFEAGRYINLGSWLSEPHYGEFSNNEFKIKKVS